MSAHPSLVVFFKQFERNDQIADTERVQRLYSDSFLVAGPGGTHILRAADMGPAVRKRQQLFDAAGCTSTRLVSIVETPLDERYSLVRAEWRWQFERGTAPADVTLPSTYIVEHCPDGPRIVCYIMHADIGAVLRERGLLPPPTSSHA